MHTYLKAKINIHLEQKNANRLPIMDEFSRKSRLIKLLCMVAFLKMHDRTMQMGKIPVQTTWDVSRCITKIYFEVSICFKKYSCFCYLSKLQKTVHQSLTICLTIYMLISCCCCFQKIFFSTSLRMLSVLYVGALKWHFNVKYCEHWA